MVTKPGASMDRLVLGTVQWGLAYGIANRSGRPSIDELRRLVGEAARAGVRVLDSARAYGDAESRIGEILPVGSDWRVVTKLDPTVWSAGMTTQACLASAKHSLEASRRALGRVTPDALLLHRGGHAFVADGALWTWLSKCKAAGEVRAIGVSAESPAEAWRCLDLDGIDVMQVAASVLDQRLAKAGFFAAAAEREVEVFVRSVFLQGVAHLERDALPAHLGPLAAALAKLDALAEEAGLSIGDLFLCYARDVLPGRILIGCETMDQLTANLHTWKAASLPSRCWERMDLALDEVPDGCLDPANWPG